MKLTREQENILEKHYLDNPGISLKDVAKASGELVSTPVSLDAVKHMSRRYKWGVKKRRAQMGKSGLPTSIQEEAEDIRTVLYEALMDPDTDKTAAELAQIIGSWHRVQEIAPTTTSAKRSRQIAIENIRKGERLKDEFKSQRSN